MIQPGSSQSTLPPALRSTRKAKGHGHLRRAEILRAAERIFLAEGYEGATIRKIADEVGVSSTCLYMHFRDKDDILNEICCAALEELLTLNSQIGAMPLDAVERARRMLCAYVEFALRNPNAYRLVFCTPVRPGASPGAETPREMGRRAAERFLDVVREIAAEGRLKTGDPESVHRTLWAACHGLASLMITKPDLEWRDVQSESTLIVEGMLFGLIAD
ncbi:MAG: TetR/AcrR family transcriptional regulator [Alphaproteobacteria bacterium]|nr:TetR/AcrR family transcriptional regulator [Alphaproteobacteria bacterium]